MIAACMGIPYETTLMVLVFMSLEGMFEMCVFEKDNN